MNFQDLKALKDNSGEETWLYNRRWLTKILWTAVLTYQLSFWMASVKLKCPWAQNPNVWFLYSCQPVTLWIVHIMLCIGHFSENLHVRQRGNNQTIYKKCKAKKITLLKLEEKSPSITWFFFKGKLTEILKWVPSSSRRRSHATLSHKGTLLQGLVVWIWKWQNLHCKESNANFQYFSFQ